MFCAIVFLGFVTVWDDCIALNHINLCADIRRVIEKKNSSSSRYKGPRLSLHKNTYFLPTLLYQTFEESEMCGSSYTTPPFFPFASDTSLRLQVLPNSNVEVCEDRMCLSGERPKTGADESPDLKTFFFLYA